MRPSLPAVNFAGFYLYLHPGIRGSTQPRIFDSISLDNSNAALAQISEFRGAVRFGILLSV